MDLNQKKSVIEIGFCVVCLKLFLMGGLYVAGSY